MTDEISHLLIAGWGIFRGVGGGSRKILLCQGGHYMKNKNTGGMFCQLNQISKNGPNAKMR